MADDSYLSNNLHVEFSVDDSRKDEKLDYTQKSSQLIDFRSISTTSNDMNLTDESKVAVLETNTVNRVYMIAYSQADNSKFPS